MQHLTFLKTLGQEVRRKTFDFLRVFFNFVNKRMRGHGRDTCHCCSTLQCTAQSSEFERVEFQ